ncbi:MAG: hypothetical protein WCH99_10255 [Verrucomicrobiota bacterium]|jgi:hypothetical protein
MNRLLHAPGLMLIAFCGLICCLLGLEAAEEWLSDQYTRLEARCR